MAPRAARAGLTLASVALALSCATAAPAPPAAHDASNDGSGYVRRIDPFVVLDEYGSPYTQPFLGGFDVPRPQFIDIDGDGDLDLFVQERSDAVMFFENVGDARTPQYVWRTDRYQDLAIGEWNRFHDMDGDGDYDLIAEQPFSYIRYYRNEGSRTQPRFTLAADTLLDADGRPVFADRQNIPNITDIDCDGSLDLFLGRVDGTITRLEEVGRGALPLFRLVTDRFENIEIVAQLGGSSRHGANAMAFADVDGDGDPDFFWGDFFEPSVLFIENTGTCPSPNLRGHPEPVRTADSLTTSGYNVPYVVDLDDDRELDLFVGVLGGAFNPNRTASDNFYFYERRDGTLHLRARRFIAGIDVGSESIPALADIDGDGDLDLLIGNKLDPQTLNAARLYLFLNEGTARQPRFRLADTLDLAASYHYAPALADIDGDGDLDIMLGLWNEGVLLYRNTGDARNHRFQADSTVRVQLTRGSNSTPALGDVDGDGDLDLFVGEASGQLNFYRNTGTRERPEFTLESDEFQGIDVGRRSFPILFDIDGDGDLDLLIGSEEGGIQLYRNTGTASEPQFTLDPSFTLPLPPLSAPAFADLDGDGDADVISGGLSGGVIYLENRRGR